MDRGMLPWMPYFYERKYLTMNLFCVSPPVGVPPSVVGRDPPCGLLHSPYLPLCHRRVREAPLPVIFLCRGAKGVPSVAAVGSVALHASLGVPSSHSAGAVDGGGPWAAPGKLGSPVPGNLLGAPLGVHGDHDVVVGAEVVVLYKENNPSKVLKNMHCGIKEPIFNCFWQPF